MRAKATANLVLAGFFGLIFGFLLQKGGVAKFNVLIGGLLLEDLTVIKVMMSAIIVGMLGIHFFHALGWVQLHIKPMRLGAQIPGGLIFGIGFALLAYCPGTAAAALGQGNGDAIFGIIGLIAGSYLFAEVSEPIGKALGNMGNKGKVTLPGLIRAPAPVVVIGAALVLSAILLAVDHLSPR